MFFISAKILTSKEDKATSQKEQSLSQELDRAWNKKKEEMITIDEEASHKANLLAFDNKAYGIRGARYDDQDEDLLARIQQDSGFESATDFVLPGSYENIEHRVVKINPVYENEESLSGDPSDLDSEFSEPYENVSVPEPDRTYQNMNLSNQPPKLPEKKRKKLYPSDFGVRQKVLYQNLDFALPKSKKATPIKPSRRSTAKDVKDSVQSITKSIRDLEEEDKVESPVYENYNFGEQTVYQNIVSSRSHKGRMVPAVDSKNSKINSRSKANFILFHNLEVSQDSKLDDDVYAQVKFLRKTVEEVNSLLETEGDSKKRTRSQTRDEKSFESLPPNTSNLIIPKPPSSSVITRSSVRIGSDNEKVSSSESRKAQFMALLSRFDNLDHEKTAKSDHPVYSQVRKTRKDIPSVSVEARKQKFSVVE